MKLDLLKNASIKWKLILISLCVTCSALVLSEVALLTNEVVSARTSLVNNLTVQGKMIGSNMAAAMAFNYQLALQSDLGGGTAMVSAAGNNKRYMEELLGALKSVPHIVRAVVYLQEGVPFASYHRDSKDFNTQPRPGLRKGEHYFSTNRLDLLQPIYFGAEEIGVIYLQSDLGELYSRVLWLSAVMILVFAAAIAFSFLLLSRLQHQITAPILELSGMTSAISRDKDYSVRMPVRGRDEVGELAEGLNEMLVQIQDRDQQLEGHRVHLEEQVASRTLQLEQSKLQLEKELAIGLVAEANLTKFARKLELGNKELQDFILIATHDLNEPLRKVQVLGDLLKAKFSAVIGEQGQSYLDRMQRASARMQSLLRDLIAISRVNAVSRSFSAVDLERTARDVIRDLAPELTKAGASVETSGLPVISADAAQMYDLVQQLMDNALKFRKAEVPLQISVTGRAVPGGAEQDQPGGFIEITVADNGTGFEDKYSDKIFRVFQQVHDRKLYGGTGIGLSICQKIVERHGGTITARSAPGAGAVFVAKLPVQQHDEEKADGRTGHVAASSG